MLTLYFLLFCDFCEIILIFSYLFLINETQVFFLIIIIPEINIIVIKANLKIHTLLEKYIKIFQRKLLSRVADNFFLILSLI